jgi:hypothetical protein
MNMCESEKRPKQRDTIWDYKRNQTGFALVLFGIWPKGLVLMNRHLLSAFI